VDTAHLKAFLRIAEAGSVSRAAESLGIAQPSLSQQLLRLEDEIGVSLFERTARGVVLTEAGKVFRERARQILHTIEQAVSDTRQLREEARGQVVLAMAPSLARLVGAPLIAALAREAPLARVRLVEAFTGSIRGWLETQKIDLGIVYDLGPLRHLSSRALASDELVLVAAPGEIAPDARLDLASLAGKSLIGPGPQHGLRQLIEREAGRLHVELHFDQDIDALDTLIQLVERGGHLTILPLCAVAPYVASGRLTIAHIGDPPLRRHLSLVRNPAHVLTHVSVTVESILAGALAQIAADGSWPGGLVTL
jgi:LysR family nitrogen assimilation transcriptional regulator